MLGRDDLQWKGNKLYIGNKYSGISLVSHVEYDRMWWIKFSERDFSTDFCNKTRAKDSAEAYLIFTMNKEDHTSRIEKAR